MWIVLFQPQNLPVVVVVDLCSLWVYFLKARPLWPVMFLAWQDYLREAGQRLHRRAGCAVQPAGGGDLAQHPLLRLQHRWAGLCGAATGGLRNLEDGFNFPPFPPRPSLVWVCVDEKSTVIGVSFARHPEGSSLASVLAPPYLCSARALWKDLGFIETCRRTGRSLELTLRVLEETTKTLEDFPLSLSLFLRWPVSYQWTHADEIEVWGHWGSPGWKIGGNLVYAFCERSSVWKKSSKRSNTQSPHPGIIAINICMFISVFLMKTFCHFFFWPCLVGSQFPRPGICNMLVTGRDKQ